MNEATEDQSPDDDVHREHPIAENSVAIQVLWMPVRKRGGVNKRNLLRYDSDEELWIAHPPQSKQLTSIRPSQGSEIGPITRHDIKRAIYQRDWPSVSLMRYVEKALSQATILLHHPNTV